MFSDVQAIPDRSIDNPQLSLKEVNSVIQFLREIDIRIAERKYEEYDYVSLTFDATYPEYSIFTFQQSVDAHYPVHPNPKSKKAPGSIFLTNGGQALTTDAVYKCQIIGINRPHLIRYNFVSSHPVTGDRLHPVNAQSYLELNSGGSFLAISEPDTTQLLVWVVFSPAESQSTPPPTFQRLGSAILAANLCGESTVNITSPKYYDGSAIPAITAVANPFVHQGHSGDTVIIHFIDFGAGPIWTIVDVRKYIRSLLHDVEFGYTQGSPDTCSINGGLHSVAVEECAAPNTNPTNYTPLIALHIHELPYAYTVPSRATEDTVRDQAQDSCSIEATTKKFCMFNEIPETGQNKTVATLTPKTFVKKIFEDTACIASQTKPIVNADIQTVYVVCFDTPIEETQIIGTNCSGIYPSC